MANPTDVISQLTYLMFIRQLDERDLDAERMEELTGVVQPRIFPQTKAGRCAGMCSGTSGQSGCMPS